MAVIIFLLILGGEKTGIYFLRILPNFLGVII